MQYMHMIKNDMVMFWFGQWTLAIAIAIGDGNVE